MPMLQILLTLAAVPAHQARFLQKVLTTWLAIPGRVNALNFDRYGDGNEATFRRWFHRPLAWTHLHFTLVQLLTRTAAVESRRALFMDASFIPKSGRKTAELGSFWNGCAGRAERGLELSCIALMNLGSRQVFPVHVRQTRARTQSADRLTPYVDQLRTVLRARRTWRRHVRVVVADGQYAKTMFFDAICDEGYTFITKLGSNANLLLPFRGKHECRRGRRRRWAGKVDFVNFDGWCAVPSEADERVWTRVVWAPHFGRFFRVVVVQRLDAKNRVVAHVVLCSTETTMPADEIRALYSARFGLEFVFRDAKQFAALETCQFRSRRALENHWNACFLSVSLVRAEQIMQLACGPGASCGCVRVLSGECEATGL